MNLLLGRSQKASAFFSLVPLRIGRGIVFHLHAELELDEEERRLLKKYNFTRSRLVASDALQDLKKAIRPALFLAALTMLVWSVFDDYRNAIPVTIVVLVGMTIGYFKTFREQILVSDLLDGGRTFPCESIVELIHKEAFLEGICEYLRQVLESAKHWTDREAIAIKPLDKADAKIAVLKASRA